MDGLECCLEWCNARAWYRLQRVTYDDGKSRILGDERYVCDLFLHRIEAAYTEYGTFPDRITEIPLEQERPELLDEMKLKMKELRI